MQQLNNIQKSRLIVRAALGEPTSSEPVNQAYSYSGIGSGGYDTLHVCIGTQGLTLPS